MKRANMQSLMLRAQLAARGLGVVGCVALAGLLLGAAAWLWLMPQRADLARHAVVATAAPPAASVAVAPPPVQSADQNLAAFYDALGERRYAEQQVKTLFDLAAKTGITLSQGEYKTGYDAQAKVHTYQVVLPVKGSYQAIWQFSLLVLRTIAFASLDEISFRRETIGDPLVEAHLRLTMVLRDDAGGAP